MIRPLLESDDPSGFSCGVHELDTYLRRHALANAAAGTGVTYVLEESTFGIGGYITLAAASIRAAELDPGSGDTTDLPRYPLPALKIARLAVDERCRQRGFGRGLLAFSLDEALVARDRIGCIGVMVDSKQAAVGFYVRFGFVEVQSTNTGSELSRMFVGIHTIADAVRRPRPVRSG